MEGKEIALRHRRLRPLRGDHDRRLVRRRQRHARLVHAARRHDPAGQHRPRRGDLRRGRRRALRHPDLRGAGDLHRRADGRAHARSTSARRSSRTRSRWRCWSLLVLPLSILGFTGGRGGHRLRRWPAVWNPAAHGLTEILYAFTSATGNNGSAFAGISANTPFYNVDARARDADRPLPDDRADPGPGRHRWPRRSGSTATAGTFPTTGPLWVGLLVGVILIVGALTYFPAYTLGPIIEHFQMRDGVTFAFGAVGSESRVESVDGQRHDERAMTNGNQTMSTMTRPAGRPRRRPDRPDEPDAGHGRRARQRPSSAESVKKQPKRSLFDPAIVRPCHRARRSASSTRATCGATR